MAKRQKSKSIVPLLFLAALAVTAIYALSTVPKPVELAPSELPLICEDGDAKTCYVGPCEGISRCLEGSWLPCRLDFNCTPGERIPCVDNGCVTGYKQCDECGKKYSECVID